MSESSPREVAQLTRGQAKPRTAKLAAEVSLMLVSDPVLVQNH